MSARALAAFRCLTFVLSLSLTSEQVASKCGEFFTWYTCWTFLLFTCYFGAASCCSIAGLTGRLSGTPPPSWPLKLTLVMFETLLAAVVLVDVTLWSVLYPTCADSQPPSCDSITNFPSYMMHGANFFAMLSEAAMNRLEVQKGHFAYALIYAGCYGCFGLVYHAYTGALGNRRKTKHAQPKMVAYV